MMKDFPRSALPISIRGQSLKSLSILDYNIKIFPATKIKILPNLSLLLLLLWQMNFLEFSNFVDSTVSPVILLEGSRSVDEVDKFKMIELSAKLASNFPNAVFRSGDADGTDKLFARGVSQVNPERLELVLPNNRKLKSNLGEKRISLEQLNQVELDYICQLTNEATPVNKPLIDFYQSGKNGSPRYKAQYLLRDALKVLGSENLNFKPATIGLFYLNSKKKTSGGTGHTIRVCERQNISAVLQTNWLNW